mmetsp:Transcript_67539/g.213803  ORF Transcript_67539/g.213803 Transcript_67539/m.213803 type:complete len:137 (-) Transcript_67539:3810-4220(-)
MAPRRSHVVVLVVLIASLQVAKCDVYLNNPRGSNNKLNEVSNNVQNDNRLFDSQNNGAGGYQVGDNCKPVCSNANNQYTRDAPGVGQSPACWFCPTSEICLVLAPQKAGEGATMHCEESVQHPTLYTPHPALRPHP